MKELVYSLVRSSALRRFAVSSGLYKVANFLLSNHPFIYTVDDLRWRVCSVDEFATLEGMLRGDFYKPGIFPKDISSVCDLGANCGMFTLSIVRELKKRNLRCLLVEANPRLISEISWHIIANSLCNSFVVNGLAGEGLSKEVENLYCYEASNVISSTVALSRCGKWQVARVNKICVEEEWTKCFGCTVPDLLKVDIEGSEVGLLATEGEWIKKIPYISVEYHYPKSTKEQIEQQLKHLGFEISHTDGTVELGTLYARRK